VGQGRAVKMGRSVRPDHLVGQPNPAHLEASQKILNPTRPTMGWWVKRVGSLAHLIKIKYNFFS